MPNSPFIATLDTTLCTVCVVANTANTGGAHWQPPHQFKKFKYELPEAVEGRSWVKELGNDVKAQEKNLKVP